MLYSTHLARGFGIFASNPLRSTFGRFDTSLLCKATKGRARRTVARYASAGLKSNLLEKAYEQSKANL